MALVHELNLLDWRAVFREFLPWAIEQYKPICEPTILKYENMEEEEEEVEVEERILME